MATGLSFAGAKLVGRSAGLSGSRPATPLLPTLSLHQPSHALRSRWSSPSASGGQAGRAVAHGWGPSRAVPARAVSQSESDADDLLDMELEVTIKGMMCDGCTSRITETLQKAPGVTKVEVSLEKGMATVEVRAPSQLEAFNMLPKLVESVRALGFEAEPHIDGLF